jgi:TRAP-type C4-dicarboxylate transport system permease small subunit
VVTRRNSHIAVELLSNILKPGPLRVAVLAFIDVVQLVFMGLLVYFAVAIVERMQYQRMTVFDLPMSIVYGGVAIGCFMMFARQIHNAWRHYREGWRKPHDVTHAMVSDEQRG